MGHVEKFGMAHLHFRQTRLNTIGLKRLLLLNLTLVFKKGWLVWPCLIIENTPKTIDFQHLS